METVDLERLESFLEETVIYTGGMSRAFTSWLMSSSQGAKMSCFTRILALRVFFVVRLSMSLLPKWFEDAITCAHALEFRKDSNYFTKTMSGGEGMDGLDNQHDELNTQIDFDCILHSNVAHDSTRYAYSHRHKIDIPKVK